MQTKETQIPLQTLDELTLDRDARIMAEKLMQEDGEADFMRFVATLISNAEARNN